MNKLQMSMGTLVELIVGIGINAVLILFMIPTFISFHNFISKEVYNTNLVTIKRLFEVSMINANSEISFSSFIEEYSDDICFDGGIISYEEDDVRCGKHSPKDEHPHEEFPWS